MELIPSIDLLGGAVVRLTRGDFATATRYGSARDIAERLGLTAGMRVHVVDLQGSREGRPVETAIVRDLASRGLRVQAGGGVRSIDDARRWFDCGVERLVVGTVAADSPLLLGDLVAEFGTTRIVPAIDLRDGQVRVAGWERPASAPLEDVLRRIEALAIREILVTDIARDGALRGPAFDLYRRLRSMTPLRIIASG
ncbi:MAG TPA: HisA/HisF-related TIM barrel protein, partial [Thermoanaerobaculia bacterium]|nr:HisA/HisF-related TIM barrel protein [Thermoanaerobaculia bacterium]